MSHQQNAKLIAALNECAAACHHCSTACLDEEDVKPMAQCIKNDLDCAAICTLLASYLARGSKHAAHLLKECIEICEDCAAECEKHSHMDHCRECAAACRACAEACRNAA